MFLRGWERESDELLQNKTSVHVYWRWESVSEGTGVLSNLLLRLGKMRCKRLLLCISSKLVQVRAYGGGQYELLGILARPLNSELSLH